MYADGYVNIEIILYLRKGNSSYAYTSYTIQTQNGLGMFYAI